MVCVLVDGAIDECLAGYCNDIMVYLHSDTSVTVRDNGRGLPVDIHPGTRVSAAENIMTAPPVAEAVLCVDGTTVGEQRPGRNLSAISALSSEFVLIVRRGRYVYKQTYRDGAPEGFLERQHYTDHRGLECYFVPSPKVFDRIAFDRDRLAKHLQESARTNPGIRFGLVDERPGGNTAWFSVGKHQPRRRRQGRSPSQANVIA